MLAAIISVIVAYLLGSINCAIILSKLLGTADPRKKGSGNPGATNVLRTSGKKMAVIVLLGDVLKGILAIIIARTMGIYGMNLAFVGLFAVVGHMFPVYFGFIGGKGIATALGVMLALSYGVAIVAVIAFMLVTFFTRYVSLGALIAMLMALIMLFLNGSIPYLLPMFIMAILIVYKHWPNIQRLRSGRENQIRF